MEYDCPSPSSSTTSSNPRKRPRTDASSEERKEARAHRNRIAAQNSRDRRKAQFVYLERRVAELEEENQALRAARGVPLLPVSASTAFKAEEEHKRLEAHARERENEELRERIRTLERGWDAVLKALSAQGVPLPPSTPPPAFPISPAPSYSSIDALSPIESPTKSNEQQNDTGGDHRATDVPAAGGLSLALDLLFPSPSSHTVPVPSTTSTSSITSPSHSASSPRTSTTSQIDPDDATMETLFMEILADPTPTTPSPAAATARSAAHPAGSQGEGVDGPASEEGMKSEIESMDGVLGLGLRGECGADMGVGLGLGVESLRSTTTTTTTMGMMNGNGNEAEWDSGLEMERILASLGVASEYEQEQQGLSELELELGWAYTGVGTGAGVGVGVF